MHSHDLPTLVFNLFKKKFRSFLCLRSHKILLHSNMIKLWSIYHYDALRPLSHNLAKIQDHNKSVNRCNGVRHIHHGKNVEAREVFEERPVWSLFWSNQKDIRNNGHGPRDFFMMIMKKLSAEKWLPRLNWLIFQPFFLSLPYWNYSCCHMHYQMSLHLWTKTWYWFLRTC